MDEVNSDELLVRQGEVLRVDAFGQAWAPCVPPSEGPTAACTWGRLPDAALLRRVLGPPLPGGALVDRAYWWVLQRPGEPAPRTWLAVRYNGEVHLVGFIAYLKCNHLEGAIRAALESLDSRPTAAPDPTGELVVTPATMDDIEAHIGRHRGRLSVAGLDLLTAAQKNALRYQLSLQPLAREVHVDEVVATADRLIDRLVQSLGQNGSAALRMHTPDTTTRAELARVRSAMRREGTLFYVDGEPEALTSDPMFDLYEELLFDEE